MHRPLRKQIWPWLLTLALLAGLLGSFSPVQVQYHKSRLQSAKVRKTRLLAQNPSAVDKFWLFLGSPVSGQELDAMIRCHEHSLVRLGFLVQEKIPAEMTSCPQTRQTLDDLRRRCQWYDLETISATNLVITACPQMLSRWHERAKELGWSFPKS